MKDYRSCDDTLDLIVQCLVHQHRMRIDYAGLLGEGHVHDFDPYTLTMYRGGLYVIGYSHRFRRSSTWRSSASGRRRSWRSASPTPRRTRRRSTPRGSSGSSTAPRRASSCGCSPPTRSRICPRAGCTRRNDSRTRRDGTTLLTMTVRGTTELVPWILSLGPYVEVLKPRALRDEVAAALRQAGHLYDGTE